MRLVRLAWQFLRYRVAIMLLLFLLLSTALHGNLANYYPAILLASLALIFSYISATSMNDITDKKIDSINHPDSPGRPLVSGRATIRDAKLVFLLSSIAALLFALSINWGAAALIALSILINVLYSVPPFRISYRTFFAPLLLGIAYVGVPYALGIAITNSNATTNDILWFAGLYAIFIGRIILKDFRDRKGDSKYNKPTFLLRFGKKATCIFSVLAILLGGLIIIFQVRASSWLALLVSLYLASILFMIKRLYQAAEGTEEQISIGIGAKMGNGLMITLLTYFALLSGGAPESTQITVSLIISGLFFINYVAFFSNPHSAVIGYKG